MYICVMRRVGGQRRKVSEWWNQEVGWAVAEKIKAFEQWLQKRDGVTYDRHQARRMVVKRAVKVEWRIDNNPLKEWRIGDGESDWGIISRVIKMFWKEVKRVRKGEQARD